MTTYRTIAATEDQVEAFVTAELAQAWTDNLLAAMEGDRDNVSLCLGRCRHSGAPQLYCHPRDVREDGYQSEKENCRQG